MNNLIVYIDIYFILNFLMNAVLLELLGRITKRPARPVRVLTGAAAGALGACLNLMLSMAVWLRIFLFLIALNWLMTRIVWPGLKGRERLGQGAALYGFTWLTGGICTFLQEQLGGGSPAWLILSGTAAAAVLCQSLFREQRTRKDLYQICICLEGRETVTTALLDTGNSLRDPMDGSPVLIVEAAVMKKIMDKDVLEYTTRVRMIPFHSVGENHGLMAGIVTDRVIIKKHPREVINSRAVVGIYEGSLSAGGAYHGLLQEELLEGETTNAFQVSSAK